MRALTAWSLVLAVVAFSGRLAAAPLEELIEKARGEAQKLFEQDPELSKPEDALLAEAFERFWGEGKGDVS